MEEWVEMSQNKITLKGCPFCRKPKNDVRVCTKKEEGILRRRVLWVVCEDCGLKSPKYHSLAELVAYWNARTPTEKKEKGLLTALHRRFRGVLLWFR